jgi:pyridoxamine 5'-phosphate oxidase
VISPIETLLTWHREAIAAGEADPDAMILATSTADGHVSARAVLFRGHDENSVWFYTNYQSRKGEELQGNARAAVVFYWPSLKRQIRIEGRVEKLTEAQSDKYFASRPRGHQIGAWASPQSQPIATLEQVDARHHELEDEFKGRDVPRPPHWGGFRVSIERIEFWQGRDNRLHERIVYERDGEGWRTSRLSP